MPSLQLCDSTSSSHSDAPPPEPALVHGHTSLLLYQAGEHTAPKVYRNSSLGTCLSPYAYLRGRNHLSASLTVCAQTQLSGIAWDTCFQKVLSLSIYNSYKLILKIELHCMKKPLRRIFFQVSYFSPNVLFCNSVLLVKVVFLPIT